MHHTQFAVFDEVVSIVLVKPYFDARNVKKSLRFENRLDLQNSDVSTVIEIFQICMRDGSFRLPKTICITPLQFQKYAETEPQIQNVCSPIEQNGSKKLEDQCHQFDYKMTQGWVFS